MLGRATRETTPVAESVLRGAVPVESGLDLIPDLGRLSARFTLDASGRAAALAAPSGSGRSYGIG